MRCARQRKCACLAYLKILKNEVIDANEDHNHQADSSSLETAIIHAGVKKKAHFKNSLTSPHPNIFVFVDALLHFQIDISAKLQSVRTGVQHTPTSRPHRKSKWVVSLISQEADGQIDTYCYMTSVSAEFGQGDK